MALGITRYAACGIARFRSLAAFERRPTGRRACCELNERPGIGNPSQMLTSHTYHTNAKEDRMCGGPLRGRKDAIGACVSFSGPRPLPCGLPQARYPASITWERETTPLRS